MQFVGGCGLEETKEKKLDSEIFFSLLIFLALLSSVMGETRGEKESEGEMKGGFHTYF